jgi:hypothetical protein
MGVDSTKRVLVTAVINASNTSAILADTRNRVSLIV